MSDKVMKNSKEWWEEIKSSEDKLTNWLKGYNLKKWPSDLSKCVGYEDLVKSLSALVKATYSLKKKAKIPNPIPWDGIQNTGPSAAICGDALVSEILSPASVASHKEQGRDLMEVILGLAVSLGIEQGRRIQRNEDKLNYNILKASCNDPATLKFINEMEEITKKINSHFVE